MKTAAAAINNGPRRLSPMRVLRAWLVRERVVRGPSAIELDVVDRQITREEQAIQAATGEAANIERRLQAAREVFRAALTDARTPGVIDEREARALGRVIVGTRVAAHRHTTTLETLS